MEVERSGGCGRRGSSDRAPGERERQERARSAAGAARRDGNAAEQEVPCTRENVRQLLVTKQDLKALVAVERLLADYNRQHPRHEPLSVLKGLFVRHDRCIAGVRSFVEVDQCPLVLVQSVRGGDEATPFRSIPLDACSGTNTLAAAQDWEQHGREELRQLEAYMRRHNKPLTLEQAAAAAVRRRAALYWLERYRGEDDLAEFLPRLVQEMTDAADIQRACRRFELVPQQAVAAPPAQQAQGERGREPRRCASPPRQASPERRPRQDAGERRRRRSGSPPSAQRQDSRDQRRQASAQQPSLPAVQQQQRPDAGPRQQQQPQAAALHPSARQPIVWVAEPDAGAALDVLQRGGSGERHVQYRQPAQQQQQRQPPQRPGSAPAAAPFREQSPRAPYVLSDSGSEPRSAPGPASLAAAAQQQQAGVPPQQPVPTAAADGSPPLAQQLPPPSQQQGSGEARAPSGTPAPSAADFIPLDSQPQAGQPGPKSLRRVVSIGTGGASSSCSDARAVPAASADATDDKELQAARQAARAAHGSSVLPPEEAEEQRQQQQDHQQQTRQQGQQPASGSRPSAEPQAASNGAAAAPASRAASGRQGSHSVGGEAAPASTKRKRAAIQWQPQESQPGDRPLQAPELTPKAPAAAPAAAEAPKAKQQKVAAGSSKQAPAPAQGKPAAAVPKPPKPAESKKLCITVRNAPRASPAPLDEEQHAPAFMPGAPGDPGRGSLMLEDSAGGTGLPPGFGGSSSGPGPGYTHERAAGFSAAPDGSGGMLTVRVQLPPADLAPPGSHHHPGGGGGSLATLFDQLHAVHGLAEGEPMQMQPLQPLMLSTYGAPDPVLLVPAGQQLPLFAAAAVSPTQQANAYRYDGQQQQQQPPFLPPQAVFAYGGGEGAFGGADVPLAPPPERSQRRTRGSRGKGRGGSEERQVQVDGGGSKDSGSTPGSGSSGGGGGGSSQGDALWCPMVLWEHRALALLEAYPKGLTLAELRRKLPLPGVWPQSEGAFATYVVRRRALFSIQPNRAGPAAGVVTVATGARGFLRFKRRLLQYLADRRPRTEAEAALRALSGSVAGLTSSLRHEMEASWLGFVAKYCGGEVGVLRASGAGGRTTALLELRPFTLDAAAAGGTAPLRPALTQECAQFFGPAGHCRHGDRCGFAHTPARSWADPVAGSR